LEDSEKTHKFIADFFGISEEVYYQKFKLISDPVEVNRSINQHIGDGLIEILESINELAQNDSETEYRTQIVQRLVRFGYSSIESFLNTSGLIDQVISVIQKGTDIEQFASQFLPGNEQLMSTILILANLARDKDGLALYPMRAHYFARNIDKLWICTNPQCTEVDTQYKKNDRLYGKLFTSPQLRCSCGAVVMELILCRNCGEEYLGGYASIENSSRLYNSQSDNTVEQETVFKKMTTAEKDELSKQKLPKMDGFLQALIHSQAFLKKIGLESIYSFTKKKSNLSYPIFVNIVRRSILSKTVTHSPRFSIMELVYRKSTKYLLIVFTPY
jgi:hypothetical protein